VLVRGIGARGRQRELAVSPEGQPHGEQADNDAGDQDFNIGIFF
jgi:hypothetical protein